MRDNRNIEELTDRAWAGMKELLDREMPVAPQRKRRPFVWWWRSAAAAVVLLLAGFFFLWETPESAPTDLAGSLKTGTETEIAVNETPSVAEIAETEEKTEETTAASALIAKPVEKLSRPGERAGAAAQSAILAERPGTKDLRTIAANDKMDGTFDRDEEAAADGAVTSDTPTEITSVQLPEGNEAGTPQRPELEFNFETIDLTEIPQLALHPLELPDIPFDQPQEYNPKKPLLIPLEIQAGLISRESMNANGFFAGMRSGLRLGASGKWSVQSGIGVQAQQHPFEISYAGSVDLLQESQGGSGLDQNGGSNNVKTDLPAQIAQSGIELHALYLDVPLLLQWQFARKWAVEAGPRLSWRLASRWEYSDPKSAPAFSAGGNADPSLNADGYSRQFYFVSAGGSNQQPVSLVMQDLYAAGSGGISYQLRPGWRLRLQYQHSISNLLDSEVYQSTDRSLRVSLGIRF